MSDFPDDPGAPGFDPQAAAANTGAGQIAPGGGAAPSVALDPIAALLRQRLAETPHDVFLQHLGLAPDASGQVSTKRKVGMGILDAIQAIGLGRNYRKEAYTDFDKRQEQNRGLLQELRTDQLSNVAQAKIDEADKLRQQNAVLQGQANATKQQLADIGQQKQEEVNRHNKAVEDYRNKMADITKELNQGTIGLDKAKALKANTDAEFEKANGGLNGMPAYLYRMATEGPESKNLLKVLEESEAAKGLGKVVRVGGTSSQSITRDGAGNPIHNNSTGSQFASPGEALRNMLGMPAITGAAAMLPGGGGLAPMRAPVAPAPAPTDPDAALATYQKNPLVQLNSDPMLSNDRAKTRTAAFEGYRNALRGQSGHRANLADAIMSDTAKTFQGPIAGQPVMGNLRNMFGQIDQHEAEQKLLDFDAVFSKLKSNVGGRYNIPEIQGATKANGEIQAKAENALMAHAANELNTQAHMLDHAGILDKAKISAPELNDAVAKDIADYMAAVKKVQKTAAGLPPAQRAAYLANVDKPDLAPLDTVIAKVRQEKKLKSVGVGSTQTSNTKPTARQLQLDQFERDLTAPK